MVFHPIRENSLDVISIDKNSSFINCYGEHQKFSRKCQIRTTKISELSELLSKRPLKLKQGLIDFWIPTFLFLKRDDFAIFND
jgi:hypothetical protein